LYDSKGVLFITTEVSDKTMRDQIGNFTGSLVNYEPNLTKSQDIGELWVFENGVKGPGLMGFQANVFNSIPGDSHYTPLWRVNILEWKTTSTTNYTWFRRYNCKCNQKRPDKSYSYKGSC